MGEGGKNHRVEPSMGNREWRRLAYPAREGGQASEMPHSGHLLSPPTMSCLPRAPTD